MTIWIPPAARPKWKCDLCGVEFNESERVTREQHVARCATAHHDQLVADSPRTKAQGFAVSADPEYRDWLKEHYDPAKPGMGTHTPRKRG